MSSKYQNTKNIYLKEKVDTIALRVPKGEKAFLKAYAEEKNKSLNSYILDLIYADIGKIPAYTIHNNY